MLLKKIENGHISERKKRKLRTHSRNIITFCAWKVWLDVQLKDDGEWLKGIALQHSKHHLLQLLRARNKCRRMWCNLHYQNIESDELLLPLTWKKSLGIPSLFILVLSFSAMQCNAEEQWVAGFSFWRFFFCWCDWSQKGLYDLWDSLNHVFHNFQGMKENFSYSCAVKSSKIFNQCPKFQIIIIIILPYSMLCFSL